MHVKMSNRSSQMTGSASARVGFLFRSDSDSDSDSSSFIFMKAFEITASLYRYGFYFT